jgi:MFS family permease
LTLSPKISNHNFYSFLWHAGFLALAQSFMDVDTIIPAMVIESGGTAMHIGIMTAIMMGGSSFTQLFFAPYISNKSFKKKFLLAGINVRVLSLFALALILFLLQKSQSGLILWLIFLFITLFALGGAFNNVSYNDILGKSIIENKRKTFFSVKQIVAGVLVLMSAFLAKKVLTTAEYPMNFGYMFLIGAILLLIASGGFWKIREQIPSALKISGLNEYLTILKSELKENKKLAYFLGFINTQGIIVSFLPFAMLYAKQTFDTQSADTGYFLLFKVLGIVTISLLVFVAAKKIKYNPLLYLNVLLSLALIFTTLLVNGSHSLRYVFILGGVVYSLFSITMNGLLLEVSGKENRALYTGFAGAGNILPALFPLSGGLIINHFGFEVFFLLFVLIVATSVFFIFKINCKK